MESFYSKKLIFNFFWQSQEFSFFFFFFQNQKFFESNPFLKNFSFNNLPFSKGKCSIPTFSNSSKHFSSVGPAHMGSVHFHWLYEKLVSGHRCLQYNKTTNLHLSINLFSDIPLWKSVLSHIFHLPSL